MYLHCTYYVRCAPEYALDTERLVPSVEHQQFLDLPGMIAHAMGLRV